jgi:translation initiation factor IF-3
MTPGEVDEDGDLLPHSVPTCKVVPRMTLRVQHQKKLDIERRQAKGMSTGPGAKNLELNWAIAGGDLAHRLEKLRGFLRDGRKVEVLIGPKKRGKKATDEECKSVIEAVRSAVEDVKGAGEVKEPEGVMAGVMTLTFQGRESEDAKQERLEKEAEVDDDLGQIKSKRLRKQKERERKAKDVETKDVEV